MDVEGAVAGEVEDVRGDPGAPVVGDDDVGVGSLEAFEEFFVVGAVADEDGDAVFRGEVGHGVGPDFFVGVFALGVGHDQDHVVLGVQEGLQGAVAPGLVTEHDDPHGFSSA